MLAAAVSTNTPSPISDPGCSFVLLAACMRGGCHGLMHMGMVLLVSICSHLSVLGCHAGCASPSCCCGGRPSSQQPTSAGSAVWREPGGCRDVLSAADAACGTLHQTGPRFLTGRQHCQQHWHRCVVHSLVSHSARHTLSLATLHRCQGLVC
jgi:hypothetical protein